MQNNEKFGIRRSTFSLSKERVTYLFLLILVTVGLLNPVAYLPMPYNGSATYYSTGAVIAGPGFGILYYNIFTGFLYVVGLLMGTVVFFKRWDSRRLTIAAGSLMMFDIALLFGFLSFFSQLDCGSTCYAPVPDIGLLVVAATIVVYTIGGIKLQHADDARKKEVVERTSANVHENW